MANGFTLPELDEKTVLDGTEGLLIDDSNEPKRAAVQAILDLANDYADTVATTAVATAATHANSVASTAQSNAIAAIPPIASQAEAEAGTNNTKMMTALLTAAAIAALAPGGGGGGAVSDVFGRTGAISAAFNDYVTSQIGNDTSLPGSNLKTLLEGISAGIGADTHGITYVSDFQTADMRAEGIFDETSHPLSDFYADLPSAQVDFPNAVDIDDEAAWCVWNEVAAAAYTAGSARVWAEGASLVNKTITWNGYAVIIEGALPNQRYSGTSIDYNGVGGTIDAPTSVFDFYTFDEFGDPPPGRTFNSAFPGPKVILRHLTIHGKNAAISTSDQSVGHGYVWGVRIRQATFVHVVDCAFDRALYDGLVFTGPQLFTCIERNWFAGCARDNVVNVATGPQAGGNSTTFWVWHNEFIGGFRLGLHLDFSGGAVQAKAIIRDNSFENANSNSFYYLHPEWNPCGVLVMGVTCIGIQNLYFDGNRFEGWDSVPNTYGEAFFLNCGSARICENNINTGIFMAATQTSQAGTTAHNEFLYNPISITDGTNADPCVLEVVDHGRTTGDVVHFTGVEAFTGLNTGAYSITVLDADHVEVDDFDSSGLGAFTAGGVMQPGNYWCDVTDQRNYNIANVDHIGPNIEGCVLDHNFDGTVYLADGLGGAATVANSVRDQALVVYGIPTYDGTYGRLVTPRNLAVPTLCTGLGLQNLSNVGSLTPSGRQNGITADPGGAMRVYYEGGLGYGAWAANTAMSPYATGAPYGIFRTAVTNNGYFFQVTAVTGDAKTGALEPSWNTTIGVTTTDHNVTWTCAGRICADADVNTPAIEIFGTKYKNGDAVPGTW